MLGPWADVNPDSKPFEGFVFHFQHSSLTGLLGEGTILSLLV